MAMKKYVTTKPSADAREGSMKTAVAVNKARVKRTVGTADSKARRSNTGMEKYGVAAVNKGTSVDRGGNMNAQYRTIGSTSKKINNGKRIAETKNIKGIAQEFMSNGKGGADEYWSTYGNRFKTSDAIVKPTLKKKAAAKRTVTPRPKKR